MTINIPYYKSSIPVNLPDSQVKAVLIPKENSVRNVSESDIVKQALNNPIGTLRLRDLAEGKPCILIITSDHTRPLPSRITLPILLAEARLKNPDAEIKVLVATGFHRATTRDELVGKFGEDIVQNEAIIVHDAFDKGAMVSKGTLPSGGRLEVNALVDWADLVIAEGFIEPHFFAGFSGGRKSILPGICSNQTIMYNHNAEFIAHPCARTGVVKNNPLHQDMLFASKAAGLAFILNVTLDSDKKIIGAYAGHPESAHLLGCESVRAHTSVAAVKADLVISSNGGYPLDQNIYQAVKGIDTASRCVNPGGVIIMFASCSDGHGGEGFYSWYAGADSPKAVQKRILSMAREETLPDQWEAQILARVQNHCHIIMVTRHADPDLIRDMLMEHADNFEDAYQKATKLLNQEDPDAVIIPDGTGVIVEES